MTSVRSHLCRVVVKYLMAPKFDVSRSVEEQRENLEAFARRSLLPAHTRIQPVGAGDVPAEWISAGEARGECAVLYLHGGAYNMGSAQTHRELVARICKASEVKALLVGYRLAPEYPHPAAVEDAASAYHWLLRDGYAPEDIVVAGDSAGGGLAIATLIRLRDAGDPLPSSAVCLCPWTDLEGAAEAVVSLADADPLLSLDWLRWAAGNYIGANNPRSPLISPVYADLRGLPPILIQVGSDEILFSDSTRLAERAQDAGVDVTLDVWENMWHVWHMFAGIMPEAKRAIDDVGDFIKNHVASPERHCRPGAVSRSSDRRATALAP